MSTKSKPYKTTAVILALSSTVCIAINAASTTASATSFPQSTSSIPSAVQFQDNGTTAPHFKQVASHAKTSPGLWQQLGNGIVTAGTHVVSGRVSSIAVSDTKHGESVYVGTANGGVWASPNVEHTHSWTALTDNQSSLSTGSVAIDPNNPYTMYVGTGEQNFSIDSRYGTGILKSTDGGETWHLIASDVFGGVHIGKIAVDPFNSNNIWVAADNGLWESTDAGQTWSQMYQGYYDIWTWGHRETPTDVYLDSKSPGVIYLNMQRGGLLKSTDGGQTFNFMGGPELPNWLAPGAPGSNMFNASLAVLEGGNNGQDTLYASYADTNGELIGIYASKDGGDTWTQLPNVPQYFDIGYAYNGTYDPNHPSGQGWYDNTIAVDPTNPNHILAGGVTLIESYDGGQTWKTLDTFLDKSQPPSADISANQHTIVFDSRGNAYVGNDGGIYEESKSGKWRDLNAGLNSMMLSAGITEINKGSTVLAGAQGSGTLLYNRSLGWNQIHDASGGFTYMDPQSPNVIFAESQWGNLVRSNDSGKTWTPWKPGYVDNYGLNEVAYNAPFTIRPLQKGNYEVLVGSECVTRMSSDGSTYTAISHDFQVNHRPDPVITMSQSKSDPNVVYVGTTFGRVYACFNAEGADPQWTNITPYLNDFINGPDLQAEVSAIAVNPSNDKQITVTYGSPEGGYNSPISNNHVFSCADTSASQPNWTNVSGNLPSSYVDSVTYTGPDVLVGTDQGVYASLIGASNWVQVGSGLPNVPVTSLVPVEDGSLIAGTYGRGAFTLDLKSIQDSLRTLIQQ